MSIKILIPKTDKMQTVCMILETMGESSQSRFAVIPDASVSADMMVSNDNVINAVLIPSSYLRFRSSSNCFLSSARRESGS